ncbi:MAG: MgtC/SapB family protein [Acidobacteriota bacterium]
MDDALWPIVVATLGGAAIGAERQWSGHASGPEARFAGLRTFTMLGGLAGLAGRMWVAGATTLAAILLAAAGAVVVAAYVAASRREIDGTTEVAALVVLTAGVAAGLGETRLASGVIAVTALLLIEKTRLHGLVTRLDDAGMRAAIRFGVMAVVILPLLPEGPYGPLGGVRPRQLWLLVLFFSGLSFAGYVARRIVGGRRGYPVAGLLGGLLSSTSVTLTFSRLSRTEREAAQALGLGVIAACTVLYARVAFAAMVLSPALAAALVPYFVAPFVLGLGVTAHAMRGQEPAGPTGAGDLRNPLQVRSALEMALLFQVVLLGVSFAYDRLGEMGLLLSGGVLGLTDTDALTLSMAERVDRGTPPATAAAAVAAGVIANTLLKGAIAGAVGAPGFRRLVLLVLAAQALVLGAALAVMRG